MTSSRRPPPAAVALVALWGLVAVLHVDRILDGRLAWVGVWVRAGEGATDPPRVRDIWPGTAATASRLVPGDRIERVGDRPLAGKGALGFVAAVYAEVDAAQQVVLSVREGGMLRPRTLRLTPVAFPWRMLPLSLGFVTAGLIVLLRRGDTRVARAMFGGALAFAFHWTFVLGGPPWLTVAWAALFAAASTLMFPLLLRVLQLLPDDGDRRRWPWVFALFGPVSTSWLFGGPLPPRTALQAAFLINVLFVVAVLWQLGRSYRQAGPVGRRQLRWVVWGIWVGALPVAVADLAGLIVPALAAWHDVAMMATVAVPFSILIAIVRANLLDIDRVLSATAAYSALCVAALAAGLAVVPSLAGAVSAAVGLEPARGQLLLSVLTAAAVVPLAGRLGGRLERMFFRERFALRERLGQLLADLGVCDSPRGLLARAAEGIERLVRPERLAVVAPAGERWAPIVVHGAGAGDQVPEALLTELRTRRRPLADRFANLLARLGAAVALPVFRAETLAAAVLIGPKRSGDVYTPTDVALLAAVADKLSTELLRFDEGEILRQERAMREALRRYVPVSVAERLANGRGLEGGERVVAVLFVDIRGSTALAEGRATAEIFAAVNDYTERVSAVIARHGGTVVEFLGDGVMAVFGAPEVRTDHARAAVAAGRELLATARATGIAVGVGIATGPAYVGNIRTAERLIYTAIGDTVNLASRLQSLTRELDAALAVDAATAAAAGDATRDFAVRRGVRVRGRREAVDVFFLPSAGACAGLA